MAPRWRGVNPQYAMLELRDLRRSTPGTANTAANVVWPGEPPSSASKALIAPMSAERSCPAWRMVVAPVRGGCSSEAESPSDSGGARCAERLNVRRTNCWILLGILVLAGGERPRERPRTRGWL